MPVSSEAVTVPGSTSQLRSIAWPCTTLASRPRARCAAPIATRPAATSTSTRPVTRKKRVQVDAGRRRGRCRSRGRPRRRRRARRRRRRWSALVDALKAASRKTAVSKPSRSTAKKAMPTSAHVEPRRARPRRDSCSSPFRPRAWRRIQTIMKVTTPTAIAPTTVSRPSCWRCGQLARRRSAGRRRRRRRLQARWPRPIHIGSARRGGPPGAGRRRRCRRSAPPRGLRAGR